MLKKVYIGEVSDVRFSVSQDFCNVNYIDCSDLKLIDFSRLHQPSLFDSTLKCFLNVDKVVDEEDFLLTFCSDIKTDVVWSFNSLRKNSKLFKKLSVCTNIHTCEGIDRIQVKKEFTKSQLLLNGLPLKYLDLFLVDGPEDREILVSEIQKFAILHKLTQDDLTLRRSVCKYNGSLDSLEFITHLLNGDIQQSYRYALKVSDEIHPLVISATILKKIKSMLYLALGDVNQANSIWRYGNFYLDQAIKQSKKIGFSGLLNLYDYIEVNFSNPYLSKDTMTRLSELIVFFERQQYKKSYTIDNKPNM